MHMYKLSANLNSEKTVNKTYQVRISNMIPFSLEYTIECQDSTFAFFFLSNFLEK